MSSLSTRPHGSTSRSVRSRALFGVGQPHLPPADHGGLQQVDHLGPAAVALAPPGRVDHRGAGGGLGVGPERLRQRPHELAQRGLGLARDGRGRADQQEQRLRLGRGQPAEVGAGAADERPPAAAAGLRVDRDAGRGQRLQVAAGGGDRHLELVGQLGGGHPTAGLHQQEGGDESVSAHVLEFSQQSAQLVSTLGRRMSRCHRPDGREPPMLRGLTTVTFFADDLTAAAAWYTELLGIEPYFVRAVEGTPAYVEFRHRRLPARARHHRQPVRRRRPVTTGRRRDHLLARRRRARPRVERLLALGATVHEEPTERGPGFVTASVVDPFGNVLGVMFNQHYLDDSGCDRQARDGHPRLNTVVARTTARLACLAFGELPVRDGGLADHPPQGQRHAERALPRGDRARAVLRVDRQPAPQTRRRQFCTAFHAAHPAQHLEPGEPASARRR